MKEGIHPNYRDVVFVDLSNGFQFVTRSTLQTKETIEIDGKTLPLVKLETTSESHPSTRARKEHRQPRWPRREVPQQVPRRHQEVSLTAWPSKGSLWLPFALARANLHWLLCAASSRPP